MMKNRKRYKKEEEVEDDEEREEGLLGQFSRQTDEAVKVKEQVKMVFKLRPLMDDFVTNRPTQERLPIFPSGSVNLSMYL
jgi:replicative superfamily II helicase